MRKVDRHVAKDGTVTFRVRFRHQGESTSITFRGPEPDAKRRAREFAGMLHAVGSAEALAWERRNDEPQTTGTPTLDEWAETYIAGRTGITDGTRHGYRRDWALGYGPLIGQLHLDELRRDHIADALNHLTTKGGRKHTGYSDKSIANKHGLLASMLKEAVAENVIRTNPCARIKLPRRTSHEDAEMVLLSQADFEAFLTHVRDHYKPLVVTLFGTGIRWGEAEALQVRDVDLEAATVRITKAAKWDTSKAERIVGPTKTALSHRTVTLPHFVADTLEPLMVGRPRSARLFVAPRGGPLRHKAFWQEAWVPACTSAGLTDPRPKPHDARHTHASWLIAAGVPLPVIQRRLGHSSIKITVDTYGHLSPDIQRAAADAADAVFSPTLVTTETAGELPAAAATA